MPETTAIIFQVIIAILSTATGVIVTYFGFRLNQKNKPKDEIGLEIIRVATHEIRKYSKTVKPPKEDKDKIGYIIYEVPKKVIEIEKDLSFVETQQDKMYSKLKYSSVVNLCVLLLEVFLLFYLDLAFVPSLIIILTVSLIIILTIRFVLRPIKQFLNEAERLIKKYEMFANDLNDLKPVQSSNLFSRDEITELIKQRNKLGYGTSLNNIKNELELYGIQIAESEIIRSHLDILHPNPEDRQEILDLYYMDGKTHTNFDELSDEEILGFIETVKKNIETLSSKENDEE